jgi:hypothetical protein
MGQGGQQTGGSGMMMPSARAGIGRANCVAMAIKMNRAAVIRFIVGPPLLRDSFVVLEIRRQKGSNGSRRKTKTFLITA